MIVRCTNCNSAFAVDDSKVNNKKFAFTCPKCDNENVIDNRIRAKSTLVGPAVVDEAFPDFDQPATLEEAVVGTGKDDLFEEAALSKSDKRAPDRDLLADSEPSLDDSALIDGLADPEQFEETSTSLDSSELPPADDMRSDIPLDDLNLDEDLKNLDITDFDDLDKGTKGAARQQGKTTFEELGDELDGIKPDDELILDEMETGDGAGEPVQLEEVDDIDKLLAADEKGKEIVDDFEPLEKEISPAEPDLVLDEEIKAEEMYHAGHAEEDESITIDLDTLDIDLESGDELPVKKKPAPSAGAPDLDLDERKSPVADIPEEDENITIDLDSLDIDLQEEEGISKGESHEELDLDLSDFSEETIQELEGVSKSPEDKDDESITLDLNSLDISLEESSEFKKGEDIDEDEKLTLEDAGLTLDELIVDEMPLEGKGAGGIEEDDIHLSIDEFDTDLDMSSIEKELQEAELILSEKPENEENLLVLDEVTDLPEIDFNDDLELLDAGSTTARTSISKSEDDLIRIDDAEKAVPRKGGLQKNIPDMARSGAVNFSIDYSIKYSRVGAFVRLFGLFFFALIPHYAIFFIYYILSIILGLLNQIIVLTTEKSVEDFSGIQENTLRYLLSISASFIGIVEEMPKFSGRDNIDYPLQLRIIYPIRSSRLLAFLRLSIIGIILLTLPHLLILGLLSLVIPLGFMAGIFSVIVSGSWPRALFDLLTRYYRYSARVLAFSIGIVDVYPRFKLD